MDFGPYCAQRKLSLIHIFWKQAESAFKRRVWLKSGGYLVFDYTEALTVVDVNTGKYVGKRSLSETVFALNCEAAREIARQLRLRDIGGIIIIDFIDMDRPQQREALLDVLRECLLRDCLLYTSRCV